MNSYGNLFYMIYNAFPWSLDGEYVPGAAQIEIETLPQALELVL